MISPGNARRARVSNTSAEVARHEEKIDVLLSTTTPPYGSSSWWYDVRGISSAAREMLRQRYQEAGWRVTISSDQRDGDALVFSEN